MGKAPVGLHKCRFISLRWYRKARDSKHGTGSTGPWGLPLLCVFLCNHFAHGVDVLIGFLFAIGFFILNVEGKGVELMFGDVVLVAAECESGAEGLDALEPIL